MKHALDYICGFSALLNTTPPTRIVERPKKYKMKINLWTEIPFRIYAPQLQQKTIPSLALDKM